MHTLVCLGATLCLAAADAVTVPMCCALTAPPATPPPPTSCSLARAGGASRRQGVRGDAPLLLRLPHRLAAGAGDTRPAPARQAGAGREGAAGSSLRAVRRSSRAAPGFHRPCCPGAAPCCAAGGCPSTGFGSFHQQYWLDGTRVGRWVRWGTPGAVAVRSQACVLGLVLATNWCLLRAARVPAPPRRRAGGCGCCGCAAVLPLL